MYAPENTVASIARGMEAGADAIEIDVHLSADGEVVVIHDPSLNRTTNGSGLVAALDLATIQSFDAGARFSRDEGRTFPFRDQGVRVPTLREVLRTFPGTRFVIELKTAAAQAPIISLLHEEKAADRVVMAAFDRSAVTMLRSSGLRTGASRSELFAMYARSVFRRQQGECSFDAIFLPRRYKGINVPPAPFIRAAAVPVHTWVENDPSVARRLWAAGIVGIVTDDPATLIAARNQRPHGR